MRWATDEVWQRTVLLLGQRGTALDEAIVEYGQALRGLENREEVWLWAEAVALVAEDFMVV